MTGLPEQRREGGFPSLFLTLFVMVIRPEKAP